MRKSLIFTGDTFLINKSGRNVFFSESIKELFADSTAICINLETSVTDIDKGIEKAFNIKTSPQNIKELADCNIRIANIANNHTYDYGSAGFKSTIDWLRAEKIAVVGVRGDNTTIVDMGDGVTIGIAGYTTGCGEGLAKVNLTDICKDVSKMRVQCTRIVVCLHWGEEYSPFPSPQQQKIAHNIIDAGADIIIGHHPHVMQGYERYNGGAIFHSLGNFNFHVDHPYHNSLIETRYSYIVKVILEDSLMRFELIPVFINDEWVPECLYSHKRECVISYIDQISKPLKDGITHCFFYSQASKHHFLNNMPAWKRRIKEHGVVHFIQMLIWFLRPGNIKYVFGLLLSPFKKEYKLIVE